MEELKLYWNRRPGVFVNKNTGQAINMVVNGMPVNIGPQFTGSVREWYETLVETLLDLRNRLLSSGGDPRELNVYVSPDVRCILESTILFKPQLDAKKRPKCFVGTLCRMRILESRRTPRFEILMESKAAAHSESGKVIILED